MQLILDEMQEDENECDKVSLERLAMINVQLLLQIKSMAEETLNKNLSSLNRNGPESSSSSKTFDENKLLFFVETRSPETLERSANWKKINEKYEMKHTRSVIGSLHQFVRDATKIQKPCTELEASDMVNALAAASVTANIITATLHRINDGIENKNTSKSNSLSKLSLRRNSSITRNPIPKSYAVDRSLFTNDGLKIYKEEIVGLLYEVGLPFICSADGQRFATQLDLSKHLDALFKRGQLEKSIASTQERGWYVKNSSWNLTDKSSHMNTPNQADEENSVGGMLADEETDPNARTMPADEARECCAVCGINFQMFFDNDDGIYKYENCREIKVFNDDAAATESTQMFVHVTCWMNLGSPECLTADQTLQESG